MARALRDRHQPAHAMRRIIGVGNRLVAGDAAGPAVCDRLLAGALPPGVEVLDGGLAGLDLLRWIEGCERVVFIDGVCGFAAPGEVVVLERAQAAAAAPGGYDHAAGLAYLLQVLPAVCEGAVPEVRVVGLEGSGGEAQIERAAALALALAVEKTPGE
jgi:hydrogenase maturation protease